MTDGRHFRDEDTVRLWPPADPWATHDGLTAEIPAAEPAPRGNGRRPVYGRVYELRTGRPVDGPHPYVGLVRSPKTIAARVAEHRSPEEGAESPWKRRILPGKAGYRQLEVVYATGDGRADEAALRRAEADWIDRYQTTYNEVRPVRPYLGDPLPARLRESARPALRRAVKSRPRRRVPWRVKVFLTLTVILTVAFGAWLGTIDQPYPWLPWVLAPSAGVGFGWKGTMELLRAGRKLKAWR